MNAPSNAKAWVGGGVVLLLIVVPIVLTTGARPGSKIQGSIGSAEDDGRRALALLLGRAGVAAEGWRQVPAALPQGAHGVWRAEDGGRDGGSVGPFGRAKADEDASNADKSNADESNADESNEDATSEDKPASKESLKNSGLPTIGMHAPEHYTMFLEGGGTLFVEGRRGIEFLRDDLELESAEGLELAVIDGDGPRQIRLASGELLEIETDLAFAPLDPSSTARDIAVVLDQEGAGEKSYAIEVPVGAGRAIAIADPQAFLNVAIGDLDHALLAVRLAEIVAPGGRLLLDEYSLGLWEPEGMVTVALRPNLALASLHIVLFALVWGWMRAVPRAFPRDPEPLDAFSPVLRARAQARMFERAHHAELLTPAARGASFDRIARILRLPKRRVGREDVGPTRQDVDRLELAIGGEPGARATELLATRVVVARADIERLAIDLARLEVDIRRRGDPHADRGK